MLSSVTPAINEEDRAIVDKKFYFHPSPRTAPQLLPLFPWPDSLGPKPPKYFNAGMFVFELSLPTYHDLLQTLKVTEATPFAEQDFLNMFFRDMYHPIPNNYNLVLAMLWRHPENVRLEEVKVVHLTVEVESRDSGMGWS
ncbi:hypothetical protein SASPL_115111 [Salvia splendens]|uniref:Hexosyltransferase n=1 Tax=Salvia splendens TaxID=180675 RepID=A0A8X9A1T7_SALSN|nr:hypothetical protein SASPL_115111 [Salvia splendens]